MFHIELPHRFHAPVGVAAEAVLLRLCEIVHEAVQDEAKRAHFDSLQWVRAKHQWVVERYRAMPRDVRRELPESLDFTLTSLYDLIRRQRNELGHPQEEPPQIDREAAFMYLKLFPTFIVDAEALAAYCRGNAL